MGQGDVWGLDGPTAPKQRQLLGVDKSSTCWWARWGGVGPPSPLSLQQRVWGRSPGPAEASVRLCSPSAPWCPLGDGLGRQPRGRSCLDRAVWRQGVCPSQLFPHYLGVGSGCFHLRFKQRHLHQWSVKVCPFRWNLEKSHFLSRDMAVHAANTWPSKAGAPTAWSYPADKCGRVGTGSLRT